MNDDAVSESIRQFFGGYFHQDWKLEAENWQGAVDEYSAEESSIHLLNVAQEIDDLRNGHDEEALGVLIRGQAHCAHNPRPLTYHEWLGQITDRLRQHAAAIDEDGPAKP
jgi:hypothetical protein